jgi:hypothetical protein
MQPEPPAYDGWKDIFHHPVAHHHGWPTVSLPFVIAIFASTLLSCTKGLFPFPYADLSNPFLINPEPKIYIFPHIRSLTALQDAYTLDAPLQLAYIGICARKYKMRSGFHVTTEDL